MAARLCLLEDDAIMGESLRDRFRMEGYAVDWFQRAGDAEQHLKAGGYALLLSDIRLPDETGDRLFHRLKGELGDTLPPAIFITGYGAIATAVQLLKAGAADYVIKPFDLDELVDKVAELTREGADARGVPPMGSVLGVSPAMRRIEGELQRLGKSGAGVLIVGESGVGKEHAARYLHAAGGEVERPFIPVNCGALPESLLEAELFGHERGAFTGAQRTRRGLFEQAHGGTLFLDEIGDMPLSMQVRLLRAIQDQRITRLGSERPVELSFSLISATHRDLRAMVAAGDFREDLYYRINTVQIRIPPLRERPEDIVWFARGYLETWAQTGDKVPRTLSENAERRLLSHPWPGNLRELEHCLERALLLSDDRVLGPEALFDGLEAAKPEPTERLADYLNDCERQHIRRALTINDGQIAATARNLGISRKNLWEKMRKLAISGRGSE